LYLVDNKGIALVLERFFTIFVNRMDNYIGFDLAINNYYNPIVGNLYFGKTLDIKPVDLIYAIRKYEMEDDILQNFNISSPNTLNKKLILFCIGIDIDGTLFNARAYVLKPFIELGNSLISLRRLFIKIDLNKELFEISNEVNNLI